MNILNFKALSKGILLSYVISILALTVLSVIVYLANIPEKIVSAIIFAVTAVSVFAGAFILAKNIECKGLLNGLMLGLGYFAVLAILSLVINGCIGFSFQNLLRFAVILASGMLGGVLGINN